MRAWMAAIAGAVVICLALGGSAGAETLRPTRFGDPKPGRCKPRDCSLREAVLAANKRPGPTTIRLQKGRYRLTRAPVGDEFQFTTGDLDVLAPLTVVGRGLKRSRILAGGIDRIIDARTPQTKVSFRRLALIGGDAENNADQPPNPWGGAIQGFEVDLTLGNTLVRGKPRRRVRWRDHALPLEAADHP